MRTFARRRIGPLHFLVLAIVFLWVSCAAERSHTVQHCRLTHRLVLLYALASQPERSILVILVSVLGEVGLQMFFVQKTAAKTFQKSSQKGKKRKTQEEKQPAAEGQEGQEDRARESRRTQGWWGGSEEGQQTQVTRLFIGDSSFMLSLRGRAGEEEEGAVAQLAGGGASRPALWGDTFSPSYN